MDFPLFINKQCKEHLIILDFFFIKIKLLVSEFIIVEAIL
jgi:hypothetical protein